MEPIECDDPQSWPKRLLSTFRELQQKSPSVFALNFDEDERVPEEIKKWILTSLHGLAITAYHATKLLPHEIKSVERVGLKPLNLAMMIERIESAVEFKCITRDVADRLLNSDLSAFADPARKGRVWFTTSALSLQVKTNFSHQLTEWGGEALCRNFEDEPAVMRILESIGESTIVKVRIVIGSNLGSFEYFDLASSLVKVWGKRFRESSGGDISVAGVCGEDICQVITERGSQEMWKALNPMSKY